MRSESGGSKSRRSAHDYALHLLSARAYTRRALERKLVAKEYPAVEIAEEIDRLERSQLLDDEKFAREYARQKLTTGGKSARRVELELISRGIGASRARAAVETVMTEEAVDIEKSVAAAGRKKLASMSGVDKETQRKRLVAFLGRRGFELDVIKRYVREAFG